MSLVIVSVQIRAVILEPITKTLTSSGTLNGSNARIIGVLALAFRLYQPWVDPLIQMIGTQFG